MIVRYPPQYPDEVPNIRFVDGENILEDDLIDLTQMIYAWLVISIYCLGQSSRVCGNGNDLQHYGNCQGLAHRQKCPQS